MTASRALWLMVGPTALLAAACGKPDLTKQQPAKFRLEGSAGQLYDLGYDAVRLQPSVTDFALLFIRQRPLNATLPDGGEDTSTSGTSEDYPLKVTYALWNDEVPVKTRVDLAEVDSSGMKMVPRAVASRDVLSDTRKTYPAIFRGTLYLNRALDPGASVHGDFNITFADGVETASGRTVFGTFDAKVEQ